MRLFRWAFTVLFAVTASAAIAQPDEPPVYIIPPNPDIAKLCETDEGRIELWESWPEWTRMDIGFQADGLGIERNEYRETVIVDRCNLAVDGLIDTFERTTPFMGFEYWYCKASWNDTCEDAEVAKAPVGFQICTVTYRVGADRGDTRFRNTPSDFLPDTSNAKRRFRTLTMELDVRGEGSLFDQQSAKLDLRDVLVTIVPESWHDTARRKHRCIMPPAPVAPKPEVAEVPTPGSIPAQIAEFRTNETRGFQFRLTNSGPVTTQMNWEVFMEDESGWRSWGHGTMIIPAGQVGWSPSFHNWNAKNWRLRAWHVPT